jgi:hypothetical protein
MNKSLSSVECATISVEDIPSATPAGVGDIGSGRRSGGRQKRRRTGYRLRRFQRRGGSARVADVAV